MNAFIRVMGMALILGGLLLFWPVLLIAGPFVLNGTTFRSRVFE